MTVKEFFKSKTFICIVVLLCIALVAGALLSIMNDLLFVSTDERVQRTVKSIYGKEIGYTTIYSMEDEMKKPESERVLYEYAGFDRKRNVVDNGGHVDFVYKLDDGNYLIKATGFQGYKQGSISIWCVARFADGKFDKIDSVSVADYEKQTLMSKFTKGELSKMSGDTTYTDTLISGASYSSDALANAYNAALAYVQALEGGEQ
jgi:hypothetical protein